MEELVKEQPVYEIQKVKIKNNQLTAEYTEKFVEANYKNNILKESEQFIHPDLLYALNRLKPHVVKICEMHEATLVNVANPSDDDLNEKLRISSSPDTVKAVMMNQPAYQSKRKSS